MKLIDKAAVVAKIEKKLQDLIACKKDTFYPEERVTLRAKINMCKEILSFLDTIEVKEVDLKEEIDKIWKPRFSLGWDDKSLLSISYKGFESIAKHFFELGIKAAQKGG